MEDIDINSLMLSAMTSTRKAEVVVDTISVAEMKAYLIRYIDSISLPDRKLVGAILCMSGYRKLLQSCSEGTVVNLDNINDEKCIQQMYDLLKYIREK